MLCVCRRQKTTSAARHLENLKPSTYVHPETLDKWEKEVLLMITSQLCGDVSHISQVEYKYGSDSLKPQALASRLKLKQARLRHADQVEKEEYKNW